MKQVRQCHGFWFLVSYFLFCSEVLTSRVLSLLFPAHLCFQGCFSPVFLTCFTSASPPAPHPFVSLVCIQACVVPSFFCWFVCSCPSVSLVAVPQSSCVPCDPDLYLTVLWAVLSFRMTLVPSFASFFFFCIFELRFLNRPARVCVWVFTILQL